MPDAPNTAADLLMRNAEGLEESIALYQRQINDAYQDLGRATARKEHAQATLASIKEALTRLGAAS